MMRTALRVVASLGLLAATLWAIMALWLRLPVPAPARALVVAAFVIAMLIVARWLWLGRSRQALLLFGLPWAALLGWWATLLPSHARDWQADMAHIATARITGDRLIVNNVRNFRWRSETDFDARWETREYHLRQLRGVDLFLSYWAGESIAHAIVSFDFADSAPLAFSIEIRKEKGEAYSALKGFFKSYELAIIAADERDIVKVRSTIRGEDVRLYRLDMQRATALGLLREYVFVSNQLAVQPRWYNTLAVNCTTVIFGMARRLDPTTMLDWRILLPGKLPTYLRERAFVSRAVSIGELVARSHIGARAAAPFPDPGFSPRIRQGVPYPLSVAPAAR
jgi:hypothetical protein